MEEARDIVRKLVGGDQVGQAILKKRPTCVRGGRYPPWSSKMRLISRIGRVSAWDMQQGERAVRVQLGLSGAPHHASS